jgi:GNAT superfamily N-acetyltransferase
MEVTTRETIPPNINIRHDLRPGDVGYLIFLHGVLYAEEYGWDHTFETYVAGPLAEFARFHHERERIWVVEKDGKVAGSIGIVEATPEHAQLRWFLLHPDLRGHGIGRMLIEQAIDFCRDCQYSLVYLWTTSALTVAGSLYRSVGFQLTEAKTHEMWGAMVTEQRYDLPL